MSLVNGNGMPIHSDEYFEKVFSSGSIQLCNPENPYAITSTRKIYKLNFEIGKKYVINPMSVYNGKLEPINEAGEKLTTYLVSNGSEYLAYFQMNYMVWVIDDKHFVIAQTDNPPLGAINDIYVYDKEYYVNEPIAGFLLEVPLTQNIGITENIYASLEYITYGTPFATIKNVAGYWEQFGKKISEHINPDVIKGYSIRATNEERNAIRIATYNGCINNEPNNWDTIKQIEMEKGVDFIGLQEIPNEYRYDGYPHGLVSNFLPYIDNTYSIATKTPWLENVILSRYEIVSATKHYYVNQGGEQRGFTKVVVKLPRYMDYYPDGDQYLSIYNTHLDLYISRLPQVRELRDEMLKDTNRFIIAVMDSNDFSADKKVWKTLTDAGFHQVHDGTSKTATVDGDFTASSSLDQIFFNDNLELLSYNIVNSNKWKVLLSNGTEQPCSDHDFVYADLKLKYGEYSYEPKNEQNVPSSYYTITRNLTNVDDLLFITNAPGNYQYTSKLTSLNGNAISSVKVVMNGTDITSSCYNASTGELSFKVTGDVTITANA